MNIPLLWHKRQKLTMLERRYHKIYTHGRTDKIINYKYSKIKCQSAVEQIIDLVALHYKGLINGTKCNTAQQYG